MTPRYTAGSRARSALAGYLVGLALGACGAPSDLPLRWRATWAALMAAAGALLWAVACVRRGRA